MQLGCMKGWAFKIWASHQEVGIRNRALTSSLKCFAFHSTGSIVEYRSLILMKNHKITNKNIKGIKSEK